MADQENSNLPLHNLTSQFLECPLCLDNYVNPKILPCQHTFCLECLENYVLTNEFTATVPCPVCRESIEIPDNDVTNFKNNFHIVNLMSFVQDIQKNESSSGESLYLCGACDRSEALSTFCQECYLELCLYCTKAHRRMPSTSNHVLLTISQKLNMECKAEVEKCKGILTEHEKRITFNHEFLLNRISQLPIHIADIQKSIESTAEAACQIIRKKANTLLQEVESFCTKENEMVHEELNEIDVEKQCLAYNRELLESISLSDDGFKNQASLGKVQRYIADTSRNNTFPLFSKIFDIFFIDGGILKLMEKSDFGTIRIS